MKTKLLISLVFILGVAIGVFFGRPSAAHAQSGNHNVLVWSVNMLSGTGRTEIRGPVVGFSCVKTPGPADTNAECFIAFEAN